MPDVVYYQRYVWCLRLGKARQDITSKTALATSSRVSMSLRDELVSHARKNALFRLLPAAFMAGCVLL